MLQLTNRSALATPGLLLAALAAGCGASHHHVGGPPGPPPVTGPPVFDEREPNDSPFLADFITTVTPSSYFFVEGHVESFGFDVVDHLEFEAAVPMAIDFYIEALDLGGDVDVHVYDPLEDRIIATYAFDGPYEEGTIVIHEFDRPFQIVIEAYGYDTAWSLEMAGLPYPGFGPSTGTSPGTSSAIQRELAPGDAGDVNGTDLDSIDLESIDLERSEQDSSTVERSLEGTAFSHEEDSECDECPAITVLPRQR